MAMKRYRILEEYPTHKTSLKQNGTKNQIKANAEMYKRGEQH
jgi:hypothetical protein